MKETLRRCKEFMRSIDAMPFYVTIAILVIILIYIVTGVKFEPVGKEQDLQDEEIVVTPNDIDALGASSEETVEPTTVATTEEVTTEEPKPEISAEGPGEVYYYDISDEERAMIAKVVYRESRGEPLVGQVAVASVVLNRWVAPEWPDTISGVITQPYQFAGIGGVSQEQLDNYPDCEKAVDLALMGWDPTRTFFPEEGAKFFCAPGITFSEDDVINEDAHTIGHHRFR